MVYIILHLSAPNIDLKYIRICLSKFFPFFDVKISNIIEDAWFRDIIVCFESMLYRHVYMLLTFTSICFFFTYLLLRVYRAAYIIIHHGGGRVVRWSWVNFQCRGVLLVWIRVGQGPTALAVGAGGGCLDIFTLFYPFSPLSPFLWETTRYRLKYCLKGSLSPKSTNQQIIHHHTGTR